MLFSIVVVTYNSQNTIIETLESIRYQVERNLRDDDVQLIIADDGSTDKTQSLIEAYIRKYEGIFTKVTLLLSSDNRGTCKNAAAAFRRIDGDAVYFIAGDDIFTDCDLFEILRNVREDEIVICPPLKFSGQKIIIDKNYYRNDIANSLKKQNTIKKAVWYSCPIMNGSLYGRNFFREEIVDFMQGFNLVDDRPRFIRYFEKYNCSVRTLRTPVLLYRDSENQVTKKNGKIKDKIDEDVKKLSDYALSKVKNPYYRFRIRMERMRELNPSLYYRVWKFCYFPAYIDCFFCYVNRKQIDSFINDMLDEAEESRLNDYIEMIHNNADNFIVGYDKDVAE